MLNRTQSTLGGETKNRIHILLAVLFFYGLLFNTALAGDKIKIELLQPPPNKLGVGDMWNLKLENTTGKDMEIYLTGTASEEKDGLIVEGRSKAFTIRPGKTNYSYKDFSNAEVKYNNGRYKEIILRTGFVPEGNYTICVTAFEKSGEVAGQENCIMQKVIMKTETQINLVSPADGADLDPDTLPGLMFSWGPPGIKGPFTLAIVELKGSQSQDDAMQNNKVFFEQKGIEGMSFRYSQSGPKFEKGKRYAWQVWDVNSKSEVWTFSSRSLDHFEETVLKLECTGNGHYDFELEIKNNADNSFNAVINNIQISSPASLVYTITYSDPAGFPTTPYPLNIGSTKVFKGTINTTSSLTAVAFNVVQDRTYPSTGTTNTNYGMPTDQFSLTKPCVCCDKVIKQITQTYSAGGNLNIVMKVGPALIKKVTIDLVYMKSVTDPNCPVCKPAGYGILFCLWCPFAGFGNAVDAYYREVTWAKSSGVDMFNTPRTLDVGVVLDPAQFGQVPEVFKECCKTEIEFCMRYSFTDINCVTCDTVICSKTTIGGSSGPRMDDTTRQYYKKIEQEMKKQLDEPKLQEKKNDGEGQGSSSSINTEYIKAGDSLFMYTELTSYDNRQRYSAKNKLIKIGN